MNNTQYYKGEMTREGMAYYPVNTPNEINEVIQQALAEERVRVRGEIEKMKKIIRIGHVGNDTSKAYDMGQNNGYNQALDDLLAFLDKPLTDKTK